VRFFEKLAPTVIAIEACGASHHWARLLQSFGHSVKLIAPQLVRQAFCQLPAGDQCQVSQGDPENHSRVADGVHQK